MKVDMDVAWVLSLNTDEMRVVLRALAGRLDSEDWRCKADALRDSITCQRLNKSSVLSSEMQKHYDNMSAEVVKKAS